MARRVSIERSLHDADADATQDTTYTSPVKPRATYTSRDESRDTYKSSDVRRVPLGNVHMVEQPEEAAATLPQDEFAAIIHDGRALTESIGAYGQVMQQTLAPHHPHRSPSYGDQGVRIDVELDMHVQHDYFMGEQRGRGVSMDDVMGNDLDGNRMDDTKRAYNPFTAAASTNKSNARDPTPYGVHIKMRVQPHTRDSVDTLMTRQQHRCATPTCRAKLSTGMLFRNHRYCHYSGQLYCASCHLKDERVIPARLLWYADTKRYKVCILARTYIDDMYSVPQLCVSAINPALYQLHPRMRYVRAIREQLAHMRAFVLTCKKRDRLLRWFGTRVYFMDDRCMEERVSPPSSPDMQPSNGTTHTATTDEWESVPAITPSSASPYVPFSASTLAAATPPFRPQTARTTWGT